VPAPLTPPHFDPPRLPPSPPPAPPQFVDQDPPGNQNCPDADGNLVPCTGGCVVLARDWPEYSLMDTRCNKFLPDASPNPAYNPGACNTGMGLVISHFGTPERISDSFDCPTNQDTGLPGERTITINMACDNSVNGLAIDLIYENKTLPNGKPNPSGVCQYIANTRSKYACATAGDPFDPYRDDPAHSFGFVVLGASASAKSAGRERG
jgi:hypothetical protein